jgi:hypothetical protein
MAFLHTKTPAQASRNLRKLRRDLRTLALFTAVYCRKQHQGTKRPLTPKGLPVTLPELSRYHYCSACRELLSYAIDRRLRCPLDPKPACRDCPNNCYTQSQRTAIKEVMAFAGPYLIKRGRFDLLWRLRFR